ncbi:MAG: DUF368 domain-containing protein [Planctomycetota bacterium]
MGDPTPNPNTPAPPPGSQTDRPAVPPTRNAPLAPLMFRGGVGGVLMGLANLVPGISGGTMLLAVGVYPKFIAGIGEVTALKFRRDTLALLAAVAIAAVAAIVLLAGPVKQLVVDHRWVMYSLFIGLTLGGVPVVWRLIGKPSPGMWAGAAAGFLGMAALAWFQAQGGSGADREGFAFMLLAGAAGASAMILPGVSGGYLLLVLGVYVPILGGIATFKDALGERDLQTLTAVFLAVVLPVGLGVLVGVAGVSNLLRYLLAKCEKPTLGVLLGLLVGAVAGLWPFQQSVAPQPGDTLKNQTVAVAPLPAESPTEPAASDAATVAADPEPNPTGLIYQDTGKPIDAEDFPTAYFQPAAGHIAGALGLIVLGLGVTLGIDRFGREKPAH